MKTPTRYARGPLGDALLAAQILALHKAEPCLGSRRVHAELAARGIHASRKRVIRLMRSRRVSGVSEPPKPPLGLVFASRHVKRRTVPARTDLVWCGDTTQVATAEGWLYITVWLDLRSRVLVGWALSDRNDAELAICALNDAIRTRRPARGLIVHSDRGVQFASEAFRDVLAANGFVPSMSRKGNCHDNAAVESFFAAFKRETAIRTLRHKPRAEVRSCAVSYLAAHYNERRRHSAREHAPAVFERLPEAEQAAILLRAARRAAKQRAARIARSKRKARAEAERARAERARFARLSAVPSVA